MRWGHHLFSACIVNAVTVSLSSGAVSGVFPGGTFSTAPNAPKPLTLKLHFQGEDGAYSGAISLGSQSFNLSAKRTGGNTITGHFSSGGGSYPFTVTFTDTETLTLSSGGGTYVLTREQANPLDAGSADNPTEPPSKPSAETGSNASIAQIEAAANAGDANAMNRMGLIYGNGRDGVPADYAKALDWYRKSADAGNNDARANLGVMYELGQGTQTDSPKAIELYKSAAANGSSFAMTRLGIMYQDGKGMKADSKEAVRWYQKAVDAGSPEAMNYLGVCYVNGDGVAEDDKKCVELLTKAADQNYVTAIHNLGKLYQLGRGVPKDAAKAMEWYQRGAKLNDPICTREIAELYENGSGTAQPDEASARKWYQSAADIGDQDAKKWLADNPPGAAHAAAAKGNIVGKWAIGGDLAAAHFVLTLDPGGSLTVDDDNGNSSSGPTYTYANNTLKFNSSIGMNDLSIGGAWKLNWKNADEFSTVDDHGKRLVLKRVK